MVPSVVTTMPMEQCPSMTFFVPSSAASVVGILGGSGVLRLAGVLRFTGVLRVTRVLGITGVLRVLVTLRVAGSFLACRGGGGIFRFGGGYCCRDKGDYHDQNQQQCEHFLHCFQPPLE